ncbi:hypothetical protein AJ80_09523 [Polytolypa hystricis UAMH7299]|uniref:Uncharacterized protein n=1 Tax=Polytolypa hystricis (strain UAMH7299) TaxID=1447883 RepID=A0A2B7WPE3_POLH7|nr:hypothetical protein AJ80_09523 [Polytolypa hystricis UAMH7299]
MLKLYTAILEFQAKAALDLGRNTISRMIRNIPRVDDWPELFERVKVLEHECKEYRDIFNSKYQGEVLPSALQVALFNQHDRIADYLLDNGADVNASGKDYPPPLHICIATCNTAMFSTLLEHKADVNVHSTMYGNLLHDAAYYGRMDIVHILLNQGFDVDTAGNFHGPALHAAAAMGRIEIVRHLVKAGADVNLKGGKFGSALNAASVRKHDNIVTLLRNYGAADAQGSPEDEPVEDAQDSKNEPIGLEISSPGKQVDKPGFYYDSWYSETTIPSGLENRFEVYGRR